MELCATPCVSLLGVCKENVNIFVVTIADIWNERIIVYHMFVSY